MALSRMPDPAAPRRITFVYEVTDGDEAAKINPLDFEHHGLRCVGFMGWDAGASIQAAHEIVSAVETIRSSLKTLTES